MGRLSSASLNTVSQIPKISVLMPAYNAERYIVAAISSILSQDLEHFKLIILNDGSTDKTADKIAAFAALDSRISVHTNAEKTGILAARDKLLDLVDTELFAWMDADDVSMPSRLRKQKAFLDENPSIDIVAGAWSIMGTDNVIVPYSKPEELRAAMLVSNPFHNPVMMVRTEKAKSLSFRYVDSGVESASDFAFVTKFKNFGTFSTLPELLYLYRVHSRQESSTNFKAQRDSLKKLMCAQFEYHDFKIPYTIRHVIRIFPGEKTTFEEAEEIAKFYKCFIDANKLNNWYEDKYLKKHLGISLKRICSMHGLKGLKLFLSYFGIREVIKGKKVGIPFVHDCLKKREKRVSFRKY